MTPSWYDVLDVDPEATAAEIRAAWRSAIGDLDPGTRRFRALNDAAEVLLDPRRRAEHDAQLAREVEPAPDTEPPEIGPPEPAPGAPATASTAVPASPATGETRWAPPTVLLIGLLVLAAALVAAGGGPSGHPPTPRSPRPPAPPRPARSGPRSRCWPTTTATSTPAGPQRGRS